MSNLKSYFSFIAIFKYNGTFKKKKNIFPKNDYMVLIFHFGLISFFETFFSTRVPLLLKIAINRTLSSFIHCTSRFFPLFNSKHNMYTERQENAQGKKYCRRGTHSLSPPPAGGVDSLGIAQEKCWKAVSLFM